MCSSYVDKVIYDVPHKLRGSFSGKLWILVVRYIAEGKDYEKLEKEVR